MKKKKNHLQLPRGIPRGQTEENEWPTRSISVLSPCLSWWKSLLITLPEMISIRKPQTSLTTPYSSVWSKREPAFLPVDCFHSWSALAHFLHFSPSLILRLAEKLEEIQQPGDQFGSVNTLSVPLLILVFFVRLQVKRYFVCIRWENTNCGSIA